MVRGKTYTFVVEGGDDKEFPAGYHPFYITDDPEGGYEFKSERERRRSRVTLMFQKLSSYFFFHFKGFCRGRTDKVWRSCSFGYWEAL